MGGHDWLVSPGSQCDGKWQIVEAQKYMLQGAAVNAIPPVDFFMPFFLFLICWIHLGWEGFT